MAISIDGSFQVARTRDEVFDFLTDPNKFAPLGLEVKDDKNFTIKVKVGVAHIRGTAAVQLQLVEADKPAHALYKGKGTVAGGHATVTASFDLEEDGAGTEVRWRGEAQIFGRLTSVAGGLLEPLAKKSVQKLIDGLQQAMS
jgi:carbon monoxide dehydrogenase subunit G